MKKNFLAFLFLAMTANAKTTQVGRDPNAKGAASGGQSLPVVGLCDYVHPCAGQASAVHLRDKTNNLGTSSAPEESSGAVRTRK